LYFIYSLPKQEDTVYFKKNWDLFKPEWVEPYMAAITAMYNGTLVNWDAPGKKIEDLTQPKRDATSKVKLII
jgi:hypothetical protein